MCAARCGRILDSADDALVVAQHERALHKVSHCRQLLDAEHGLDEREDALGGGRARRQGEDDAAAPPWPTSGTGGCTHATTSAAPRCRCWLGSERSRPTLTNPQSVLKGERFSKVGDMRSFDVRRPNLIKSREKVTHAQISKKLSRNSAQGQLTGACKIAGQRG